MSPLMVARGVLVALSLIPISALAIVPALPGLHPKPSTTRARSQDQEKSPKRYSNVFANADIRQVLQELSTALGVTILADTSLRPVEVSLELKDDTAESALRKLSVIAGFLWKLKDGQYLVSTAAPDAPLFNEFAETEVYVPRNQTAESLFALLAKNFQVFASFDRNANLISITAPRPTLDAALGALRAADARRRQFVVEALVTEIESEVSSEVGFSWNWRYFAQALDGGLTYAKATTDDVTRMKALLGNRKATLKANPSITSTEGREALLTVGQETYFTMTATGVGFQTVQFQKVSTGITLRLTGFVDPDGTIRLHLQPEVSDVAAPVGGNPTVTLRRADTTLSVKSGETIALGGLIQEITSDRRTKVPILGDLPIVGEAFRRKQTSKRKVEVVILITPRLLESSAAIRQ